MQKLVPGDSDLRMCYECISILAELFRFYTEFMEMTKEASFIQSLLEESSIWSSKSLAENAESDTEEMKLFESAKNDDDDDESESEELESDPLQLEDSETADLDLDTDLMDVDIGLVKEEPGNDEEPDDREAEDVVTKEGLPISRITRSITQEVNRRGKLQFIAFNSMQIRISTISF